MFTPIETAIGSLLLYHSTTALLFNNGVFLGLSGLVRQAMSKPSRSSVVFFAGMLSSWVAIRICIPDHIDTRMPAVASLSEAIWTAGAGAMVGWGTKVVDRSPSSDAVGDLRQTKAANGCTSGHMLCGLSHLRGRSAIAVAIFLPTAMITHHAWHPTLRSDVCPPDVECYRPIFPSAGDLACLLLTASTAALVTHYVPRLFANWACQADVPSPPHVATYFVTGLEFGLGLYVSQMALPDKVLAFLSFPRLAAWDPSLLLVLLFGVLPSFVHIRLRSTIEGAAPKYAPRWTLPRSTVRDIEAKFVLGAAVFGMGWGMTGTCPGPAVLRSIEQMHWGALWFGGFWGGSVLG